MSATPSWYDILDVAPDASPEEVREAWKTRIDGLEPTDRRFRVANQAAEVLLDPARREQYDAELAAQEAADAEPAADEAAAAVPASPAPVATREKKAKPPRQPKKSKRSEPTTPTTPTMPTTQPTPARTGKATRRLVPGWVLVVLAALTLAVAGTATYVATQKPSDASIQDATRTAQAAAERAVGPILSYDAAHLDEDQRAAESYMTSSYRAQYDKLFAVIKQNAPSTKTVVTASVVASGIVRSGDDRVDVLLFVNRPTTNKDQKSPIVYKDQVTVTMQKVDGDWLVDNLQTSPVAR